MRIKTTGLLLTTLLAHPLAAQQMLDSTDSLTSAMGSVEARTKQGYFPEALEAEKKALQIAQNRYGTTHPSIVPFLNNLAVLDRYLARYQEAESALKWGLAIRERSFGLSHPSLVDSLDHLGSLYAEQALWNDAEFMEKKALSLLEKSEAKPETRVLVLNHLAEISFRLGKSKESQSFLKRSLEFQEKNPLGPGLLIATLNLSAEAAYSEKRFSDSESSLQRALAAAKKSYPTTNVEMGDAMKKLADFYQAQGQWERAQPLYDSALPIFQRFVGVNYSYEALPYLKRLGKTYQALGKNKDAKFLLEKVLGTAKEVFGPQHPQVALALQELAILELKLDEKKSAKDHLQQSLTLLQSHFSPNHPWVAKIQSLLGR